MGGGKGYTKRTQKERREEVGKRARIREGGEGEREEVKQREREKERKGEHVRIST